MKIKKQHPEIVVKYFDIKLNPEEQQKVIKQKYKQPSLF